LFFSASSPCNSATEDCATDPNNGSAICTCKLGYERNNTTGICTGMTSYQMKVTIDNSIDLCMYIYIDINECATNADICDVESSFCSNNIGSYSCNCKLDYQV
jgi:hypothetical protein